MKNKILVPVDNTPVTQDVIRLADSWGQRLDAKLFFLHARSSEIQNLVERGELIDPKEGFEHYLENTKCSSELETIYRFGAPYQTILDAEQEFVPEMIIMAAHTHTMLGRVFLGSNTDHVLHEGHTTMYVYKQPQKSMNQKRAVVPIDYSPVSNEVIRKADQWALENQVELFFLYVQETPEMMNVSAVGGGYYTTSSDYENRIRHSSKQVEELEERLRQRVRENNVTSQYQVHLDFGKPYIKILDLCEGLMASTLIMASHSHTTAGRLIMGSNTDYLLHHAHCSMYILKNYELDEA